MKTKYVVGCTAALLLSTQGAAQDWTLGGNVITTNEWFGADLLSNIPLSFETRVNQPMQWRTNNVLRMRLTENLIGQTINAYPGLNLSGFLGLGPFTGFPNNTPFTMLHLDNGAFNDAGYRPWMRTGATLTQGSDLAYFGFKNEGVDINHTVVTWSDNTPGVDGPDLLKFIFNRNNAGGTIEKAPRLPRGFFVRSCSVQRTALYPSCATISGFTNVKLSGYLGISNQPLFFQDFFNTADPFSRLHLADSCNNKERLHTGVRLAPVDEELGEYLLSYQPAVPRV